MNTIRLHTTPKVWLIKEDDEFNLIPPADREAILKLCEESSDELSEGKWKKLHATIRNLASTTNINFCGYETTNGFVYDVTNHSVFRLGDKIPEPVNEPNKASWLVDEIKQLQLKIEALQQKQDKRREELKELLAGII